MESVAEYDPVVAVSREVIPIPDQAKMILVRDQTSMTRANEMFLVIKGLRKKIDQTFDPIISRAWNTHKEALAQKKKVEEPLIIGEKWLNSQMTAYYAEQERLRKEEEDRIRKAALEAEVKRRQKEEERKLAEAAVLEASGAKEEADQLVAEAIQAKEEPVVVEYGLPDTPMVQMRGATVRKYWSAEVFDLMALVKAIANGSQPISYVEAKMSALNGQAESLKEKMNIPGVRAKSRSGLAATGK